MKKADLSMNTIVIAAIVLIVLVVIVLIFTGRIGGFTRGLNDCQNKGGESKTVGQGCLPSEATLFKYKSSSDSTYDDMVCCLKLNKDN